MANGAKEVCALSLSFLSLMDLYWVLHVSRFELYNHEYKRYNTPIVAFPLEVSGFEASSCLGTL